MRERCYTTIIIPSEEYASQIWDPHYQADVTKLEKNKKRAARFATNNYTMEPGNSQLNLQNLGWQTLEERRLQAKLSTFQKARLNILDLPLDHLKFKNRQTRLGGDGPMYLFSPLIMVTSFLSTPLNNPSLEPPVTMASRSDLMQPRRLFLHISNYGITSI